MKLKSLNSQNDEAFPISIWLNMALILVVLGFIQIWVLTFYYQTKTNEWISWIANDGNSGSPFAFGQHYFGDYLTMHNVAISRDIQAFDNSYPPLGVIPFWLISWLPYRLGLYLWFGILGFSMLFPLFYSFYKTYPKFLVQGIACLGVLTVPFISVMDRGNSVGLLTIFLFMFYLAYRRDKLHYASIFLGLAIGFKVYPLVIIPFLIVRKEFRLALLSFVYSIIFNLMAILIWNRGNPLDGLKYSVNRIMDVEQLFKDGHGMYLSAAQVLTNFLNRVGLDHTFVGNFLIENYKLVSATTLVYLLFGAYLSKGSNWILLMFSAIQLIPTISFSYYRVWSIAVVSIIILEHGRSSNSRSLSDVHKIWMTVSVLNLAPLPLLNFWPINLLPTLVVICILLIPLVELKHKMESRLRQPSRSKI